ncbi:MAG: bifunctional tetrahydrofolate synthase/dihydrofolate synthase [Casimicrobiaceae bacterium]
MASAAPLATLQDWLEHLQSLHPQAIALGLERVQQVLARLDIAFACPVITVAGTNGKGSTCAMLASILGRAGYRAGLYTSPHLLRYNERVVVDGVSASDDALCASFATVERARGDIALTYFEFGTLAAFVLFAQARLDALVLEVGLGGRLDAVNVIDADIAVLTRVGIDHVDYLGSTREAIGFEKSGIFRAGRVAVIGERDIPRSVTTRAQAGDVRLVRLGHEYDYVDERSQWRYSGPGGSRYGLPVPALRGAFQLANAATALAVVDLLRERLPVSAGAVRDGLVHVEWPGRFQVLPGRPLTVLDVAHNPQAAQALAGALGEMGFHPCTYAVFAALADKDVEGVVRAVAPRIDRWFIAPLAGARGQSAEALRARMIAGGVADDAIDASSDIARALDKARDAAAEADRIVVFGSFVTVAAALAAGAASLSP